MSEQPTGPTPLEQQSGRDWLNTIALHDVAEKMQIGRAAAAKGWGLDPREWAHPFGSTNVTLPSPNMLKTAALTIGSALLGGLGTYAVNSLVPDSPPPAAAAPVAPGGPQEFDVTIEAVDGEMRVTEVEQVTTKPPE